jgi:hypothetical protein
MSQRAELRKKAALELKAKEALTKAKRGESRSRKNKRRTKT